MASAVNDAIDPHPSPHVTNVPVYSASADTYTVITEPYDTGTKPKMRKVSSRKLKRDLSSIPTQAIKSVVKNPHFLDRQGRKAHSSEYVEGALPPPDIDSQEEFPDLGATQNSLQSQITNENAFDISSDTDMELDEFIKPKKTAKQSKDKTIEMGSLVEFKNKFGTLNPNENTDNKDKQSKPLKPPPLFIYGIENKYTFTRTLKATCQIEPLCNHNKERILIQTQTKADYDKIVAFCTHQKVQYASELPKRERPLKAVIRKLPNDTLTTDIKQDLIDLGFPVTEVTQMSGRDKITKEKVLYPLFLITYPRTVDTKELFALQYLLSYRISVEAYKPAEYLQCFQCQRLGHSQQTCWSKPRCLKCAELHLTKDCPKKTRTDPAKCANCGGSHPANYRGCIIFKTEKAKRNNLINNFGKKNDQTNPHTTQNSGNKTIPNTPAITENATQRNRNNQVNSSAKTINNTEQNPATNNPQSTSITTENSLSSMFNDIKQLIQGLNIRSIFKNLQNGLTKYKEATDMFSKITAIGEMIINIFDDGTK